MRLLLDAHTLIWAVDNPNNLGDTAEIALQDKNHELLLSAGTVWEISIKVNLAKLNLSIEFGAWIRQAIDELGCSILPIEVAHAEMQTSLPRHHGDPFDRLLAAQAIVENASIVSSDSVFDKYGVVRTW